MKFIDMETLPQSQSREKDECYLSVGVNGHISILKGLVKLLDLKAGDKIALGIDAEGEVCLVPRREKGFVLRGSGTSKGLLFSHIALAESIIKAIPDKQKKPDATLFKLLVSKKKFTYKDGDTAYECFPVITSSALCFTKRVTKK